MKISINKFYLPYILIVSMLCIYTFTRGGVGLLVPMKYWMLLILLVLVFSVYKNIPILFSKKLSMTPVLLYLMVLIVLFWNNWNIKNGSWFLQIIFVTYYLFLVAGSKTDCWFKTATNFMLGFGLFNTFWTILCFLSPWVFYNIVYPIVNQISYYSIADMYEKGFMTGFNYTNSHNAIYLTTALCVAISVLFFHGKKHKHQKLFFVITILLAISLLLTGKRGPILWLAFAFVVTYYFYNCNKPLSRYVKLVGLIIIALFAFYIGTLFIPELANFITRFIEMAESGDITTHRLDLWQMGMEGFYQSPIVGNGWQWFMYNNPFGLLYNTHNCYVQWLCELGIVGSIPFFALVIRMYVNNLKLLTKARKGQIITQGNMQFFLSFAMIYQTYFLVYCFAGTSFYEPECLLPYIFSCSMVEFYWRKYKNKELNIQ